MSAPSGVDATDNFADVGDATATDAAGDCAAATLLCAAAAAARMAGPCAVQS